jgi:hypothetical protein
MGKKIPNKVATINPVLRKAVMKLPVIPESYLGDISFT